MSSIQPIKPVQNIVRVNPYDNSQLISRGLKQSVVTEGTILNCFATDTGGTTNSESYVTPDTTASAVFVRCETQALGSDFKVVFNLSANSAVTVVAGFGLYIDSDLENTASGALYIDSVKIEPDTTTFSTVSEAFTLHYSTELTKGNHTVEVKHKTSAAAFGSVMANIRISIFSQQLIHK